ncbi:hypothetical protein MP228_006062 [Amoeboaphelidium protococcarum]|nr:hypothetical protein MP228_006062 [Amoeboaphelidium protococcarum]
MHSSSLLAIVAVISGQALAANVVISNTAVGKFAYIQNFFGPGSCSGQPDSIIAYANYDYACPADVCNALTATLGNSASVNFTQVSKCASNGKMFDTSGYTEQYAITSTFASTDCSGDAYQLSASKANTCIPVTGQPLPYVYHSCNSTAYDFKTCHDSACTNCTAAQTFTHKCQQLATSSFATVCLGPNNGFSASVPLVPAPVFNPITDTVNKTNIKSALPDISYFFTVPQTLSRNFVAQNGFLTSNCSDTQPDFVLSTPTNGTCGTVNAQCSSLNVTSNSTALAYRSASSQCSTKKVFNGTGWSDRVAATFIYEKSTKCQGDPDYVTVVKAGVCLPAPSGIYGYQKYDCKYSQLVLAQCFDNMCRNCSATSYSNGRCLAAGASGSIGAVCLDQSSQYRSPYYGTSDGVRVKLVSAYTFVAMLLFVLIN